MINVRVDFSLGGILCRWWACLCAGALNPEAGGFDDDGIAEVGALF